MLPWLWEMLSMILETNMFIDSPERSPVTDLTPKSVRVELEVSKLSDHGFTNEIVDNI